MVNIRQQYYKRSRPGKPPIEYDAIGYRSSGKVTDVTIKKDPILKKYPQLEKDMMRHELIEIKLRSKGILEPEAHKIAMSREPKSIKGKTLKQIWNKLK